jgi:hypothetical protein
VSPHGQPLREYRFVEMAIVVTRNQRHEGGAGVLQRPIARPL